MARHLDIFHALRTQLHADLSSLKKVHDAQAEARAAYLSFLDLEKQRQRLRERVEATACLVLPGAEAEDVEAEYLEELDEAGLTLSDGWKDKISTWRIIAEVVRQFPKMQIAELVRVLNDLGIVVSRQAVESALSTHDSKFRITKKGRERFVSLK